MIPEETPGPRMEKDLVCFRGGEGPAPAMRRVPAGRFLFNAWISFCRF